MARGNCEIPGHGMNTGNSARRLQRPTPRSPAAVCSSETAALRNTPHAGLAAGVSPSRRCTPVSPTNIHTRLCPQQHHPTLSSTLSLYGHLCITSQRQPEETCAVLVGIGVYREVTHMGTTRNLVSIVLSNHESPLLLLLPGASRITAHR